MFPIYNPQSQNMILFYKCEGMLPPLSLFCNSDLKASKMKEGILGIIEETFNLNKELVSYAQK